VNGRRLHVAENIHRRFLDEIRGRHIGVAQAKIVNILLPYLSGPLPAEFKDGANRRFLCP
jgi:hypothetical protein